MAGRRAKRVWTLLFGIVLLAVVSGCSVTVGCKTYTMFEPPTYQLSIDETACAAPPAVIPEVPLAVLLPVAGIAMVMIGLRVSRRRALAR